MTTDPHKLCLDIIEKAKSFPRECVKRDRQTYTITFSITTPPDNPNNILEAIYIRTAYSSEKLFNVFLYDCNLPLSPHQAQEIFFALESLYTANQNEFFRELEKQNRERLQAAIRKAQNLLNSNPLQAVNIKH